MLDHSTILYGSNMSNSDRHNNDPLPAAMLGHAHGRIKGGQHLKYPQDSRFADLLVTLFDRNNIPVEKLGDSGGILRRFDMRAGAERSSQVGRGLATRSRRRMVAVVAMRLDATAAETTLLDAAERGDRATALRLLAKGANPNAPGPDGTTAIMWAASNDDLELVRALIKAGANVKLEEPVRHVGADRGRHHRLGAGHRRAAQGRRRSQHQESGR